MLGTWTGLNNDWTASPNNCLDWSNNQHAIHGVVGVADLLNVNDVIHAPFAIGGLPAGVSWCDLPHTIYCAQQ